jgi:tRNA-2-methylthio-N6-dimethylallyladenosine synthase
LAKSLFIKTYGCQMNVYDSNRMTDILAPLGYEASSTPDGADMVILNTCHIREKAAEKVFSELGRLRFLKEAKQEAGENMILAVAGCVAQAEGDEIVRRAPYVDMVFGPQTYHRLPEMVARASRQAGVVLDTDFPVESKFDHMPNTASVENSTAFLTIQEGCDKFCTFCVVPYTRGTEFSRPVAEVLDEARRLRDAGAREITLLGQNVNAYHGAVAGGSERGPERGPERGLGDLIRDLAEIDGIERLRYTTSYPAEVDDALIEAHRDVPELMPFLHLPVQSGSDRVLSAMNRRHDSGQYRDLVERLRAARPDIGLSSDFIVGFPGETEKDFEQSMDLIRDIGFLQAFSFKYSPRPGTPAASMPNQVEEADKSRRLAALQALLVEQQVQFNKSCIGNDMPVLLEKFGRHDGQLVGRSPYMQAVHVQAPADLLGSIVSLRIDGSGENSLSATAIDTKPSDTTSGAARMMA